MLGIAGIPAIYDLEIFLLFPTQFMQCAPKNGDSRLCCWIRLWENHQHGDLSNVDERALPAVLHSHGFATRPAEPPAGARWYGRIPGPPQSPPSQRSGKRGADHPSLREPA